MPTTSNELDMFLRSWEHEAKSTDRLLAVLPAGQYDFRPDPKGRSLGELAWHLSEIDGYIAHGVAKGTIDFQEKIAGLERPRTIAELAPGYARVHAAAVAEIKGMKPEDFDKEMPFMDRTMRRGDILWGVLLSHAIHHRGQLVLLTRLSGGVPVGMYGPTREEMAAMRGA